MWYRFSQLGAVLPTDIRQDLIEAVDNILTNSGLDEQQKADQLFMITRNTPGMNPQLVYNRLRIMPFRSEEIKALYDKKIYPPKNSSDSNLPGSETAPAILGTTPGGLPSGVTLSDPVNLPPPPPPPDPTTQQGNTGTSTPQSPAAGNQADATPKLEQKYFQFYKPGLPQTKSNWLGSAAVGGWAGYMGPTDIKYDEGYEPIYELGSDGKPKLRWPDGQPIVKGLKYDSKDFNTTSMDAAFKESGVQFIIGGGSANNPIPKEQKDKILNYLKVNKDQKNMIDEEKLPGLNVLLYPTYKAERDPATGVLEVTKVQG